MSLKKKFLISLFLSIKIIANCQTVTDLKLITRTEDFKLQERVLLTLDQDFYLAGESINFSALTFDLALQMPIEFSSIVYVELFNQDNNVICEKKVLLKKGECVNDLTLPRKLETGYYYIRAYTNYMKNFGVGSFFTKKIKIVNPFFRIKYQDKPSASQFKLKLDISSEGGKIVSEIENRIAFSTPNFNDTIHAFLYKNDSVIAKVNSQNGFGIFSFTPLINNKYRIEATTLKGGKAIVELNDIVQSGVTLKLDSVNDRNAYLKVIAKNYDKFPISLFVENNTILYEYAKAISTPESLLKIELPIGLNKITLKNSNQEEVSQRLIYIKPKPKIEITAKLDKPKAFQGDSVILHINTNVNDSIHYVVALNLGNQNTSPALGDLIESTLYNSSIASFAGNVSFDDMLYSSSNSRAINDYLLKFQHTPVTTVSPNTIKYLPEISNDIVSGSVIKTSDQSFAVGKNIYLSFIDSICWTNRSKTDNAGRFVATLPIHYQGNNLIVSVNDTTENYTLKLDNEFYPDFLKVANEHYYPDSSLKDLIELRMLNLQVNDAYAEPPRNSTKPLRPTLRFYGYADSEYKSKKYLVPNIEEFISEIVKKATIVKKGKRVEIKVFERIEHSIIGDNPLIIFDGIPLSKTDNVTSIPTDKIESIRIVSNKFFFGSEVFDGIVDITSTTKSFDLIDLDKNSIKVGFSPVLTTENNYRQQNLRIPSYFSNIYFNKIESALGNENIVIRLPQNKGKYSLSVFGYTNAGECGSITIPNVLTIGQ